MTIDVAVLYAIIFILAMDIFNSILEIEASNRYIAEAEKQLDIIQATQPSKSFQKTIEPVFTSQVKDLKYKMEDEIDLISRMIETIEDEKLIPETVNVQELIGKEMEAMPEWFATAIQKQLEKHRVGLNTVVRKMFKSMFSENQKQGMKKDMLNADLIIKRMIEFDKAKLSNSQMIQLLALISRFEQQRTKYVRFLNDCAKKVIQFVRQNQEKAVSFSSSNKVYVEDMRSPEQWSRFNFADMRENMVPNVTAPANFYHNTSLGYDRPSLIGHPVRIATDNSFAYQRALPANTAAGFYRQERLGRGVSPMIRDINIKQEMLRGTMREPHFARQPPIKDTGRNFYYRQASSLSRPMSSNPIAPSYPLNNLYRDFYY